MIGACQCDWVVRTLREIVGSKGRVEDSAGGGGSQVEGYDYVEDAAGGVGDRVRCRVCAYDAGTA